MKNKDDQASAESKSQPKAQQKYRDRQIEKGLVQFNIWVTPDEREELKKVLFRTRGARGV